MEQKKPIVKEWSLTSAEERLKKLKKEMEYLEILIDVKIRENHDIFMDSPPPRIGNILRKEYDMVQAEYINIMNQIKSHRESTTMPFLINNVEVL